MFEWNIDIKTMIRVGSTVTVAPELFNKFIEYAESFTGIKSGVYDCDTFVFIVDEILEASEAMPPCVMLKSAAELFNKMPRVMADYSEITRIVKY